MKNLMIMCPNLTDASSLYRGMGPLSRLRKELGTFTIGLINEYNWATLSICDVFFMQRPYSDKHRMMAEIASDAGAKIWVDYDDYLLHVPTDNPVHSLYSQPNIRKNIATIAAMADLVTLSTPELAEAMGKLNSNTHVIPNALDLKMLKPRAEEPTNPVILWRGSSTHMRDLMTVESQILELAESKELAEWKFLFLGHNPWWLTDRMPEKNTMVAEALEISEYFKFLNKARPAIVICPLHDSPFNRAKSNIAYLEAAYAGAVCVAPDFPEFQRPGCALYNNRSEFKKSVLQLVSNSGLRSSLAQQAWSWTQNQNVQVTNTLRSNAFERLFAGQRYP